MIVKAIEIRDRHTFIPALAVQMVPSLRLKEDDEGDRERYLLRRAGYTLGPGDVPCVILCRMDVNGREQQASHDPYEWGAHDRTFQVAHQHIIDHFDELESGAVIDVEYLLQESKQPKKSERIT